MTGAELLAALEAAESGADVLAALARAIDPTTEAPTPEALADWWPQLPEPERADASSRLWTLIGRHGRLQTDRAKIAGGTPVLLSTVPGWHGAVGSLAAALWVDPGAEDLPELAAPDDLADVALVLSRGWLAIRGGDADRAGHPLAPIVRAWVETPPTVVASTRPDPFFPVVQSMRETPERTAGRLAFGGILDVGDRRPGQLPLFPTPAGPRVAILELVDAHGVPTMTQGRGAPLELATFVAACISTPHDRRASRGRIVTTVAELRAFLFGPGRWRPSATAGRPGDWERMREAVLSAGRLWLPLDNGDLWRTIAVRRIPPAEYGPSHLQRRIVFDVELPPGAAHGPKIDRVDLSNLRRQSGPRFRAFIAAHSIAWLPGRTRVPHPGGGGPRLWSADPTRYPVLTPEDRRRLAFGDGDTRNRTRADLDAPWSDLPGVTIVSRRATTQDGRRGWLIVPDAAAAAVGKHDATREDE